MEEIFKYLGLFSAATIVAYGLIKFLAQKIFENYLQKSIETHKSNLERLNISHEIQFSTLHKERAIVIRELYRKFFDYKTTVIYFFNMELSTQDPVSDLKHRLKTWSTAVPDFSNYFHLNRIYFSKNLCSIIDNLNNEMDKINGDSRSFLGSYTSLDEQIVAFRSKEFINLRDKTNKFLGQEIEKISNELETQFRKILGVET